MDDPGIIESSHPVFHGYAPRVESDVERFSPPLTVAISRETGARGRDIADRVATRLGWQFITQETLEYMTDNVSFQSEVRDALSPAACEWVDRHLSELSVHGPLAGAADITALARIILEVAAQGHCVVLGRGAGCLLPPQAKLYVRLIAPEKDRIAYISQVERLSWTDAEKFVRERDKARHQFITKRFGRAPTDVLQYDLVLNTALLGVEASSEIIAAAANAKQFRA